MDVTMERNTVVWDSSWTQVQDKLSPLPRLVTGDSLIVTRPGPGPGHPQQFDQGSSVTTTGDTSRVLE